MAKLKVGIIGLGGIATSTVMPSPLSITSRSSRSPICSQRSGRQYMDKYAIPKGYPTTPISWPMTRSTPWP